MSIAPTAPVVIDGVKILSEDVVLLNHQLQIELEGGCRDRNTIHNQERIIATLQEIIRAYQKQNQKLVCGALGVEQPENKEAFKLWLSAHCYIRNCNEQIEFIRECTQDDLGI